MGLMGTQLPLTKKGNNPQFLVHGSCGQTAGWIKMPLGTEVDLGPSHILLGGNPAALPSPKGAQQPPLFGRCLLWPNGRPSQLLMSTCNSNVTNNGSLSNTIAWIEAFFRTKWHFDQSNLECINAAR